MRQLNKGEALHDLRSYLMIANKGQLRRKRGDELVNQASSLNLVTNAIVIWNTVYMAQTQHLNHEPPTVWNTLSNNELWHGDLLGHREYPVGVR